MANISGKKKQRRGSNSSVVIIVVLIIGLLVGIESFSISYNYMMADEALTEDSAESLFSANRVLENAQANLIGADLDGVVKEIDTQSKEITFLNLKANTTISLKVNGDTKYPENKTFENYMVGDIVTYVYDKDKNITELKSCADAWEYSDQDASVNTKANLIKFGENAATNAGKSFKYADGLTTVRYKDKYMGFGDISSIDYVTVRGYGGKGDAKNKPKKVYSIEITKGHGQLVLQNYNSIIDGKLSIGDATYNLADQNKYELMEGSYTIKITSSNRVDWMKEVNISPAAPCTLDLSKIEEKMGNLVVVPNVSDCNIYVDDNPIEDGEQLQLGYGEHKVTVTKQGYTTYSEKVMIDKDNVTLTVNMVIKPKLGTVYITVSPSKAAVYVDGKKIGTGSTKTEVEVGQHTITAKADGFTTDGRTVNVTYEGETVECGLVLTPSKTVEKEVIPSTRTEPATQATTKQTSAPAKQQPTTTAPATTQPEVIQDIPADSGVNDAEKNDIYSE